MYEPTTTTTARPNVYFFLLVSLRVHRAAATPDVFVWRGRGHVITTMGPSPLLAIYEFRTGLQAERKATQPQTHELAANNVAPRLTAIGVIFDSGENS